MSQRRVLCNIIIIRIRTIRCTYNNNNNVSRAQSMFIVLKYRGTCYDKMV